MTAPEAEKDLTASLVALMKGVAWREDDAPRWQSLLELQARVRDYVSLLGLELILDDAEGYAYLRQRPIEEGAVELPRLVARRQLSYPVSLLLALLRRKLAEFDARGGDTRLILSSDEIADLVRVFLPDAVNEARLLQKIETHVQKIVDLGFLRRLKGREGGREERYEVLRILKAFVDAQWMHDFEQRLADYRAHGGGSGVDGAPGIDGGPGVGKGIGGDGSGERGDGDAGGEEAT